MIAIYWHCLGMTGPDERFVAGALEELAQYLRTEPIKLEIAIRRLGDEPQLAKEIGPKLKQLNDPLYRFNDCAADIGAAFPFEEGVPPKLLVYCLPDSDIAKAAQRDKPLARWGATCSPLAAIYKPDDKNGIFHETLHLLGVDDCYIEDDPYQKKSDCNLDGCIMEYDPPENTWENWPFLCKKNVKKLKDIAKKA